MEKNQELVGKILEFIDGINRSKTPVIVEGIKDKAALISLGMKRELIFTLKKPLYEIAEELAKLKKSCIILTDLDKEGIKLHSQLLGAISSLGVKVDERFRTFLFKETELRQIEGIGTYIEHISENRR